MPSPPNTMSTCLTTPVALLIFNRPTLTERVFEAVAKARPERLLVVADGPRFPGEEEKCARARAVVERVDWDCQVLTNFAERNLGCRGRVSSGLDWVFSQVEEAIILEDDCLPAPSFFRFCQELLARYRHDERVMHIGGVNFQDGYNQTPYSYYFSRHTHCWGWATWRRAWQFYGVDMSLWPENRGSVAALFDDEVERDYFTGAFEQAFRGEVDTWDYQWAYACMVQSGLSALPSVNLVSNIGWGAEATHTKQERHEAANRPTSDLGDLHHPPFVILHRAADRYTLDNVLGGAGLRNKRPAQADPAQSTPLRRIKSGVRNLIGR